MKNVCVVGYGAIGPIHAEALNRTETANFYAVCDINPEKIQLCKEKYSVEVYTNFDEMLLDKDIDSIHICTPHYLHFEMIKKALKAGKTVVCEKPVTMTKKEYDDLIKLKNSDKVCIVLQNRINPCFLKLKQIIDNGEFGTVKAIKGVMTWCRSTEYYEHDKWRGKWTTEGGGVLINQAIHTLDYLCYIGGEIDTVKSKMMNFSLPEIEVEDTCVTYLKFKNGVTGIFFATNANGNNSPIDFEVTLEKGVARYTDGKLYINRMIKAEDSIPEHGKFYWGRGHETLIKNYYDLNSYFNPKDVKNTMNTLFAIYESADNNGKEIKL